jgi:hypothetical protein
MSCWDPFVALGQIPAEPALNSIKSVETVIFDQVLISNAAGGKKHPYRLRHLHHLPRGTSF